MANQIEPNTATRRAQGQPAASGAVPTWRWTIFGSGLLVGLLTSISMIAAISMIYP